MKAHYVVVLLSLVIEFSGNPVVAQSDQHESTGESSLIHFLQTEHSEDRIRSRLQREFVDPSTGVFDAAGFSRFLSGYSKRALKRLTPAAARLSLIQLGYSEVSLERLKDIFEKSQSEISQSRILELVHCGSVAAVFSSALVSYPVSKWIETVNTGLSSQVLGTLTTLALVGSSWMLHEWANSLQDPAWRAREDIDATRVSSSGGRLSKGEFRALASACVKRLSHCSIRGGC